MTDVIKSITKINCWAPQCIQSGALDYFCMSNWGTTACNHKVRCQALKVLMVVGGGGGVPLSNMP